MKHRTTSKIRRSGATLLLLSVLSVALATQEPRHEPRHEYVDYTIASPAAVKPFEKVDPKAAGSIPRRWSGWSSGPRRPTRTPW